VSGVNVTICDGKYTVIQEPTGGTRVLRYGEDWRDVTGDNVIGGLAWELQESRERIKRLEEAGDKMEPWCSDWAAASNWEKAKEDKP
jgi:hypothetical protein